MNSRSPLRTKPLRHAGQSLDEQIDRLINDKFLDYLLITTAVWLVVIFETVASVLHLHRHPGWYGLVAIVTTAITGYQFKKTRRSVRRLKQGRDGEREVAEWLEDLRQTGAQVIHDVPGDGFNIDHVVICNRGIYAVETKTWSKSEGRSQIEFDGERITISGKRSDSDPLRQCGAQAAWLSDLLKRSTSKTWRVRGILTFPGWWVEQLPSARGSRHWVLNPKKIGKWIAQEPDSLIPSDVAMATLHLQQYVRNAAHSPTDPAIGRWTEAQIS